MAHNSSARDDYISLEEATALASAYFNTKNLQVVNYRVRDFADEKLGYLATHNLLSVKVQLLDDEQRSEKICTFFVKALAPDLANDFEPLIFQEEEQFFRDVLPRLMDNFKGEPWAPKCHLVKGQLIILEDLKTQRFKHVGHNFTENQLKTSMASVARFHACSMLLQANLGEQPLPEVLPGNFKEKTFINDNGGYASRWLDTGVEVAESVARDLGLDPKHVAVAYDIMLKEIQPVDSSPENVLAHEDLWSNNLLFSEDEQKCRLIDFQMLAYSSFAIDVLQILYLNADKDTRQPLELQLVQFYYLTLKKTLIDHGMSADKVLSLEQVSRAVEKKRICGLVMAVQYRPISLLDKQFSAEYAAKFEQYAYTSRSDLVNKAMEADQHYRDQIQKAVRELIEYMEHSQTP